MKLIKHQSGGIIKQGDPNYIPTNSKPIDNPTWNLAKTYGTNIWNRILRPTLEISTIGTPIAKAADLYNKGALVGMAIKNNSEGINILGGVLKKYVNDITSPLIKNTQ